MFFLCFIFEWNKTIYLLSLAVQYNQPEMDIISLSKQVREELTSDILPFWLNHMTSPDGGFYGRMDGEGNLDENAPKGLIMNARLLWTFSNALRVLGPDDRQLLEGARRAERVIAERFTDKVHGGAWWSLDADNTPHDRKKQVYAIAFAIYGLAEFCRATGDEDALALAKDYFWQIEKYSFDSGLNGYIEAFTEDWKPIGDMRLSDKDANESKTMNTHLHVLEAYTGLYRVWKDARLRSQLRNMIELFLDKILGPDGHLKLFFDEHWVCNYNIVSYGHDIEASWLLYEAALVLGDKDLIDKVAMEVPHIVDAASEGFSREAGMIYEKEGGRLDGDRHWWVQAESVVGYFNAWQLTGRQDCLDNAVACWNFIRGHLLDKEGGEWFWSLRADGSVNREDDKAGFWKCPYHNGRMCMELIERIDK